MKLLTIIIFSLTSLTACATDTTKLGKLVIAGGAVSSDNQMLYQAFIDAMPNKNGNVMIIPVASGNPVSSASKFKQDLIRYGLSDEQIDTFPLAVTDDKNTEFDETSWKENAFDEALVKRLDDVNAIWFTGGDQMRIIESIRPTLDKESPLLQKLKQRLNAGAVIGGTSAGAAMMSETMIAAGDSFSALTEPQSEQYYGMETQEQGQLYVHHGLGLFPYGIVDQHFDRKARLGRLVRTLADVSTNKGYAVDEDSAMVIDLDTQTLTAVGIGNITLVDTQKAVIEKDPFKIFNVKLTLLSPGDQWNLSSDTLITDSGNTVGKEYFNEAAKQGAGLAMANKRLVHLLGYELLDNKATSEIRRYSFIENGKGILYRFSQTEESRGYWRTNGTKDQYSIINVNMDIEPISISIGQ